MSGPGLSPVLTVDSGSKSRRSAPSAELGRCLTPLGTTCSWPGPTRTSPASVWIERIPESTRKSSSASGWECQLNSPTARTARRACWFTVATVRGRQGASSPARAAARSTGSTAPNYSQGEEGQRRRCGERQRVPQRGVGPRPRDPQAVTHLQYGGLAAATTGRATVSQGRGRPPGGDRGLAAVPRARRHRPVGGRPPRRGGPDWVAGNVADAP